MKIVKELVWNKLTGNYERCIEEKKRQIQTCLCFSCLFASNMFFFCFQSSDLVLSHHLIVCIASLKSMSTSLRLWRARGQKMSDGYAIRNCLSCLCPSSTNLGEQGMKWDSSQGTLLLNGCQSVCDCVKAFVLDGRNRFSNSQIPIGARFPATRKTTFLRVVRSIEKDKARKKFRNFQCSMR